MKPIVAAWPTVVAVLLGAMIAGPTYSLDREERQLVQLLTLIEERPDRALSYLLELFDEMAPSAAMAIDVIEHAKRESEAAHRSQIVARYLRFDLDGDFQVSADEIAAGRALATATNRPHLESAVAAVDTNRDGVLTAEEISQAAARQSTGRSPASIEVFVYMDVDANGEVTRSEVSDFVMSRTVREDLLPHGCSTPPASETALAIYLVGGARDALSSVTVAGQEVVTRAARVEIEDGDLPLYIVANAGRPVIWQLSGATERVEHFVTNTHSGATGLDEDKVVFVGVPSCLPRRTILNQDINLAVDDWFRERIDRPTHGRLVAGTTGEIQPPTGPIDYGNTRPGDTDIVIHNGRSFAVTPDGIRNLSREDRGEGPSSRSGALRAMVRFNPGGVTEIDPSDVTAAGEAVAYEVLPRQAGLLQLIEEGAIVPAGRSNRGSFRDQFRIVKPIPRFPIDLNGAHAVTFLLAPGVPMPAGSPGHSSVISEEDGTCISGTVCR